MNESPVAARELAFMCADTGAVVALTYAGGKRPALASAVIFLAAGDTLWVDGEAGGARGALAVRDRGQAGQHDLLLSAQAEPAAGPAALVSGRAAAAPRVPVSLDLALEPASQWLGLGPGGRVALVRGGGTLSVGSVIHRVEGLAWSGEGPGGGPGAQAGSRARAVFQDGSALYVASGEGGASPVAALVHNTRIRPVAVSELHVRGAEHGRPGRTVSWSADGRAPAGAVAEIRDPRQWLTVTRPGPGGPGGLSWGCAPYLFVRSGVTGLGLADRRARLATTVTPAEPADELPDPY